MTGLLTYELADSPKRYENVLISFIFDDYSADTSFDVTFEKDDPDLYNSSKSMNDSSDDNSDYSSFILPSSSPCSQPNKSVLFSTCDEAYINKS